MKIICTQENLLRNLSFLEKVVVRQMNLPILSNILLQTENGRVKMSATNLEIGVMSYMGAKIQKEGIVTLPAKILHNFVTNIPVGEVIEITSEDKKTRIESGNFSLEVFSFDGKDFPIIPQYKGEDWITLDPTTFKETIHKIIHATSTNEVRPELTGVYLLFQETSLYLVATDSFRLVEERLPLSLEKKQATLLGEGVIIPQATLQEIVRIIMPETQTCLLALKDNQVFFKVDEVEITSRIINGNFPDYQKIIPQNYSDTITFSKEEFQRALKITGSLTGYTAGEIAFIVDKKEGNLSLVSQSSDIGKNVSSLSFESKEGSKSITFVFQIRFLQDFLNTTTSQRLVFSYNTETSPVLFQEEGEEVLYIIMPIRK
jgi:DNA polymerase-3 subunit beta